MAPLLEIMNLRKSYDGLRAVDGLDMTVRRNEIFGLLGPNGAGKTTTLKVVVGLLKMDSGIVRVNGADISEDPYGYKVHIGYMPENPTLPEYLTAKEFLGYIAKVRAVASPEIKDRISRYMELFELERRRDDLIVSLSRGMKQKLALAAALIHDPPLLLLDEPFIGIDPSGQRSIKDLLRERVAEQRAVLVSTHMLDTAERLCDRVAIIHHGRNLAAGDLSRLRQIAAAGEDSSLEDLFLHLTREAAEPPPPEKPRRRGLFGRLGR